MGVHDGVAVVVVEIPSIPTAVVGSCGGFGSKGCGSSGRDGWGHCSGCRYGRGVVDLAEAVIVRLIFSFTGSVHPLLWRHHVGSVSDGDTSKVRVSIRLPCSDKFRGIQEDWCPDLAPSFGSPRQCRPPRNSGDFGPGRLPARWLGREKQRSP